MRSDANWKDKHHIYFIISTIDGSSTHQNVRAQIWRICSSGANAKGCERKKKTFQTEKERERASVVDESLPPFCAMRIEIACCYTLLVFFFLRQPFVLKRRRRGGGVEIACGEEEEYEERRDGREEE